MAQDLTKEILPIEEQKQTKKILYKNWKFYATALGIITVGLAVGLGIGLGVENSSHNTITPAQKIVNEINKITNLEVIANTTDSTVTSINNLITSDFISAKLTGDNKTTFEANKNKFALVKITVGKNDLVDNNLKTIGTINAKLIYNYDSIKNQTTNLIITVSDKNTTDIVNQINITTYETNVEINSTIDDLIFMPLFIQSKLTFQNKTGFNANLFTFNKITVNSNDLQNSDLTTEQTINAKINYNYDNIANQTTNLTMTVGTNVWSEDVITKQLNTLTGFTVNYDQTTATITTVTDQLKAMYVDTFTSIKIQNEIKENLIISNLNRSISGTHTPWTDDDLRNGATSGTTWFNLTFKNILLSSTKIVHLNPVIIDVTLLNYLSSTNSSTTITYDKATVKIDSIKNQMLNIVINSITSEKIQNYLNENLTIARLYTSARVDGQTIQTDVTDERLSNGETTGDYEYLLTKCILGINEAESKVITLRLYPN